MVDLTEIQSAQAVKLTGAGLTGAESSFVNSDSGGRMFTRQRPEIYNTTWCSDAFLNGTSKEMNVNGSVTPVNFTITPPAGVTYLVYAITFLMLDTGTPDTNEFGGLGVALTNGVDIEHTTSGVSYNICNIKDNGDLALTFNAYIASQYTGFLNDNDMVTGTFTLPVPIVLNGDSSDFIRFRIRDNLTGLNYFRARALICREI